MSSKESLIKSLYEATAGKKVQSPGKRLVESTNTLVSDGISDGRKAPLFNPLPEIHVEEREYREILNGAVLMKCLNIKFEGVLKEIRLIETNQYIPTGNTCIICVAQYIRGNGSNGIVSGYTAIVFKLGTW